MTKNTRNILLLTCLFILTLLLNLWTSSNEYTVYILGVLLIQGVIYTVYMRNQEKGKVSRKTSVIVESIMIILSIAVIAYLISINIETMMKLLFLLYQSIFLIGSINQLIKTIKV